MFGYEDTTYEISNLGRIRNGGRVLKPWLTLGYPCITLCRNGEQKKKRIHVLVAEAFLGPRPEGATDVRHLDGNPGNPVVTNLAYGTRSDNMCDATAHGRNVLASRIECKHGHPYTPDNTQLRLLPNGRTTRVCIQCRRRHRREQYERDKAREQGAA